MENKPKPKSPTLIKQKKFGFGEHQKWVPETTRANIRDNIVTPSTYHWVWVEKPHPTIIQTFCLWRATSQKKDCIRGEEVKGFLDSGEFEQL